MNRQPLNRKIIAVILLLCTMMLSIQSFALSEALEQEAYADWLWEPVVEKDASLSTGQVTLWACVTFGSYPQTEIVSGAVTTVDDRGTVRRGWGFACGEKLSLI